MYYVEAKLVLRLENKEDASDLLWAVDLIDQNLEGEEEVVYLKTENIVNEGVKQ